MKFTGALFLITLSYIPIAIGFEITRKRSGDEIAYFPCNQGTIVVMDDATHSLKCAKTMKDAGCDLIFKTTRQTLYIPSKERPEKYLITTTSGDFCDSGFQPRVGDLFIQDYPTNIYADVWSKEKGAQSVNNSFQYYIFDRNKIQLAISRHWPGLLVKLYIQCYGKSGWRDLTQTATRRCVTLKFSGYAKYPIDETIFTNTGTLLATTETVTADSKVMAAAVKADMGNPFAWAIALSIAAGIIVCVVCMGVWTVYSKCRKQKQLSINDTAQIEDPQSRNNVTRISYNQMEMSPIVNVDTTRPISQIITITPSRQNRRRTSKSAVSRKSRAMHLGNDHLSESNDYLENKYTPPYEFYDEDYFFEKAISSKVDKEKGKINRGKIRTNIHGFHAFESPMEERNLREMVKNTPNHQRSINAMVTTPSNRRKAFDTRYDSIDAEDENLPSGTKEIIAEINRAYSSFEETLQREKEILRRNSTKIESETPTYQGVSKNNNLHSPLESVFDASSEAIDAMFDLGAYDNEIDSVAESQEIEMDMSAEKTISNTTYDKSEEYNFQPYAFKRNSQATINPLYSYRETNESAENNSGWTRFGETTG